MEIWAKMGPFWAPGGTQKGPNTRSKWVVTMSPTQAADGGQLGPNLVHRGPPRTSEVPKRTLFASF